MPEPAQLIASNLGALPHPDGAPRQLAGFASTLLPEPLREQVDRTAREIGDSVVYLLETNGYRIVSVTEESAAPPDPGPAPIGHLHCRECDARLLSLNLTTPGHIVTNGRALIAALSQLSPDCPHHARV